LTGHILAQWRGIAAGMHTTHNTQHTTHSTQHTRHKTQDTTHTRHNTQHTTHNTQDTRHNTHTHTLIPHLPEVQPSRWTTRHHPCLCLARGGTYDPHWGVLQGTGAHGG
jgi:carbohydrate-binding DOMON domain-containing protein